MEAAKNDVELTYAVYVREKEPPGRDLERIPRIAVYSRESRIKEVNNLKVQFQDSSTRVEEAARYIDDPKSRLEDSNARLECVKREISEDIKGQLDGERKCLWSSMSSQISWRRVTLV